MNVAPVAPALTWARAALLWFALLPVLLPAATASITLKGGDAQPLFAAGDFDCAAFQFAVPGPECHCDMVVDAVSVRLSPTFPEDELLCPRCSVAGAAVEDVTLPAEKVVRYSAVVAGSLTLQEFAGVIGTIEMKSNSTEPAPRTVVMNFGHALYLPATGHFYDRLSMGYSLSFHHAQTQCATRSFFGLIGYLPTVTSEAELAFMPAWDGGNAGYIGASDYGREGDWRWVTGPEGCAPYPVNPTHAAYSSMCPFQAPSTTVDYANGPCLTACSGGTLIGQIDRGVVSPGAFAKATGAFVNWEPGEPTMGSNEHFAFTQPSRMWTDKDSVTSTYGVNCEWGGVGTLCLAIKDFVHIVSVLRSVNECEAQCSTCETDKCSDGGQGCDDPDHVSPSDWRCVCATGTFAVGGLADCDVLDECTAVCSSCTAAQATCPADRHQTCFDPQPHVADVDDWRCQCVAPAAGVPTAGGPALCALDECAASCATCDVGGACAAAGGSSQSCIDPAPIASSLSDWECRCDPPLVGTGKAAAAHCSPPLDECSATCPSCAADTCLAANQTCSDPAPSAASLRDWECVCRPPLTGRLTGQVSPCVLDECTAQCASCAGGACPAAQSCSDPQQHPKAIWNWLCTCPAGQHGTAVVKAATCADEFNECAEVCPTCEQGACTLTAPHQHCTDATPIAASLGDWECHCLDPYVGSRVKGRAQCSRALDECTATCPTCESGLCDPSAYTCYDAVPTGASLGDWVCYCTGTDDAYGTPVRGLPTCRVNECLVAAPSSAAFSEATELRTWERGTWQVQESVWRKIELDASLLPQKVPGLWYVYPTINQHQMNIELKTPDTALLQPLQTQGVSLTLDDGLWVYQVYLPSPRALPEGRLVTVLNTAAYTAVVVPPSENVCSAAGQACVDVDVTPGTNDWYCECTAPAIGRTVLGVHATCSMDECSTAGCPTCANGTCIDAGQFCADPNDGTDSLGDWSCQCYPPSTGANATAPAAQCLLNECTAMLCATCANTTCSDASQDCRDGNESAAALSDWVCECVAPATGSAVGAAAPCALDECTVKGCSTCANATCKDAGQTCDDPNTVLASPHDWRCTCPPPLSGHGVTAAAACSLNECTVMLCATCANSTCVDASPQQDCRDGNESAAALSDWTCECIAPSKGSAVGAAAQQCELDECSMGCSTCANATCIDVGQVCSDGFAVNDWACFCTAPATGPAQRRGVAKCVLDECRVHNATCAAVGQMCRDADTAEASAADWLCECRSPTVGAAVAGPAACALDECAAVCSTCANATCSAAGQDCTDVDTAEAAVQDWVCSCRPPFAGQATRAAAVCDRAMDECEEGCSTCEDGACDAAGQVCEDDDRRAQSLADWWCICRHPFSGRAALQPVSVCEVDECSTTCLTCAGHACANAMQACVDPHNGTRGDWVCVCPEPSGTNATGAAAVCELDECTAACGTCAGGACAMHGKAVCLDPEPLLDSLLDWECHCVLPLTGGTVAMELTVCILDECAVDCTTCERGACAAASQTCRDPDTAETAVLDWACWCPPPAVGDATAKPAECVLDECTASCVSCAGETCAAVAQVCFDEDVAFGSLWDWMCRCAAPDTGAAAVAAAAAACPLDECLANCSSCAGSVCADVGQRCRDASPHADSVHDWECLCGAGASEAAALRGPVAACPLDECAEGCNTCAFDVCEGAQQGCADPEPRAASLRDWECRTWCAEGQRAAVGAVVSCATGGGANGSDDTGLAARGAGPEEGSIATMSYTAAKVGSVGVAVGSIVGSPSAALRLLMTTQRCYPRADSSVSALTVTNSRYPHALHPTQWSLSESTALGCLVGNAALLLAVSAAALLALNAVLRPARRCLRIDDPHAVLMVPGLFVIFFQILSPGLALAAAELIFHPPSVTAAALAGAALTVGIAAIYRLARSLSGAVPQHAYYMVDPAPAGRVAAFFLGPGEWVSRARHPHWADRWSSVIRRYSQRAPWYVVLELGGVLFLAFVQGAMPETYVGCGHQKLASAMIVTVQLLSEMSALPHCHARNQALDCGAMAAQVASCVAAAMGYYSYTGGTGGGGEEGVVTAAAAVLALIGFVLVGARTACDGIGYVWTTCKRRRARLQRAAWGRCADGGELAYTNDPDAEQALWRALWGGALCSPEGSAEGRSPDHGSKSTPPSLHVPGRYDSASGTATPVLDPMPATPSNLARGRTMTTGSTFSLLTECLPMPPRPSRRSRHDLDSSIPLPLTGSPRGRRRLRGDALELSAVDFDDTLDRQGTDDPFAKSAKLVQRPCRRVSVGDELRSSPDMKFQQHGAADASAKRQTSGQEDVLSSSVPPRRRRGLAISGRELFPDAHGHSDSLVVNCVLPVRAPDKGATPCTTPRRKRGRTII
eukprot:TRINITY_DN2588_c0_g1_i1.p1 TRINITY_DN2588_c0_g1~~TRINITY_DN2588_c0_g1_i1.p1  ORF type:complete len:2380 (+),score=326.77 TRINITY_DN2588_c0_g1_i1:64-7203(+)